MCLFEEEGVFGFLYFLSSRSSSSIFFSLLIIMSINSSLLFSERLILKFIQRSKTSPLKGFSEHYKKVTWIFKPVNQLNKYVVHHSLSAININNLYLPTSCTIKR